MAHTTRELGFDSGGVGCVATLYEPAPEPGDRGPELRPCLVLAHGFSLTQSDGLPLYARAFASAGVAVLSFDYRFLGDSGGEPRQRFRSPEQRADILAAHRFAATLPGIDPSRVIPWGYSFGGGHLVALLAAGHLRPPAALVLCPFIDGLRRITAAPPGATARVLPHALLDAAGVRRTIPATGEPGSLAAMTFPGEARGFERAVPSGSAWRNEIGAGVFATVALHRPWLRAGRIECPLWVGLGERDVTSDAGAVRGLARRAPRGELHRYPVDHFEPLLAADAGPIAADQLAFLERIGVIGS